MGSNNENHEALWESLSRFINHVTDDLSWFFRKSEKCVDSIYELGIEMADSTKELIRNQRKFKSDDRYVINELVRKIDKKRCSRNLELQKEILNIQKGLIKAEQKAIGLAEKRNNIIIKSSKKMYEQKYGKKKGRMIFKQMQEQGNGIDESAQSASYDLAYNSSSLPVLYNMAREEIISYRIEMASYHRVIRYLTEISGSLPEIEQMLKRINEAVNKDLEMMETKYDEIRNFISNPTANSQKLLNLSEEISYIESNASDK